MGNETMKGCTMTLKTVLTAALAVLLMSCTAQGQRGPKPVLPEVADRPHWKVFRSHSSHRAQFFRRLLFGRLFVHEHSAAPGMVGAEFVRNDGRMFLCFWDTKRKKYALDWARLDIETHSTGAARKVTHKGGVGRALLFYQHKTGAMNVEVLLGHKDPDKRERVVRRSGWIQESWPRVLANACPDFVTLSGLGINEKQTSRNLDELRKQDPDALIRHFPGSQHTGPGRTGLAASGGAPTTTYEEIETWMRAQEGNVLLSSLGNGYVFSEGWTENTQIWKIGYDGHVESFGRITRKTDASGQQWSISEVPGVGTLYYPIGYPVPLMSTGHRYPAWQLTDELIGRAEPVPLPWMGERYEGYRFLFHDKTLTIVAPGDEYFTGRWRWTKGRLQVTVDGEEQHARSIDWRDLARALGVTPTMWTPDMPNSR